MPFLSIIVPIYKAENFLSNCVESILSQKFKDFELILVDDGSPDKSGEICDRYASLDERVLVIHKKNEGPNIARMTALKEAKGKYVTFVDSDDFVSEDMFEVLVNTAVEHSAEVVTSGYIVERENKSEPTEDAVSSGIYSGEKLISLYNELIFNVREFRQGIAPAMWGKIFLRESALKNILPEADQIYLGEDCLFTYNNILNASCVVVCNEHKGYHYVEYENSITHSYRKEFFHDINILYDTLKKITNDISTPEIKTAIAYNYVFLFFNGIMQEIGRANKISYFKKYKSILAHCSADRFRESVSQIDVEKLPKYMKHYTKLLAKNKIWQFMFEHLFSAVLKRIF